MATNYINLKTIVLNLIVLRYICVDWIQLAQDKVQWWALVNIVRILRIS